MIKMQMSIMLIVNEWAKENKTPVPFHYIVEKKSEEEPRTIRASVQSLCRKGYLRKSCERGEVAYVRLRNDIWTN